MHTRATGRTSERGAVIIQVAAVMLGLMAFSAFVVDYGIMWTARGQAQTAADAGALAGAISLAFDSRTDFAGAKAKAKAVAQANFVWGQAPDVQLTDVSFLTPAVCTPPAYPGVPDTCVKVDVFRNQARNNPLPMLFGTLVGVTNQGVRATATAQIATGDTTNCLRPWAVVDRWQEAAPPSGTDQDPGPYGPTSTYDRYSTGQGNTPPYEPDVYTPPSASGPGTGFQLPQDQGIQFAIKVGSNSNAISSGWFRAINLPRADGQNGANVYRANIGSCNGLPSSYADPTTVCPATIGNADLAYWAARGCYAVETGNMIGPTAQGIGDLVALDPNARWIGGVGGSIDPSSTLFSPATSSPRVVPIGVLDIDQYLAQNPNGSGAVVRMVNLYGFFIEGMGDVNRNTGAITCCNNNGNSVIGRILSIPGYGTSRISSNASFLNSIILVR